MARGRLIIIGAAVILLLGGGAAAAYFFVPSVRAALGGKPPGDEPEEAAKPKESEAPKGGFADLKAITASIRDISGHPRLLRLSASLKLDKAEDKARVEAFLPRILDAVQIRLRRETVEELSTTAGRDTLREDIRDATNREIAPGHCSEVLIREFIIE